MKSCVIMQSSIWFFVAIFKPQENWSLKLPPSLFYEWYQTPQLRLCMIQTWICCWFPWKIFDVCLNNRRQNKRQRTAHIIFCELKYAAYSIEYYYKKSLKGYWDTIDYIYDRNRNTLILFSNIFSFLVMFIIMDWG